MSDEQNRQLMEDAADEGLKAVMGDKFQDMSQEPRKEAPKAAQDFRMYPPIPGTAADFKVQDSEHMEYPTYAPNWFDRLKGCGKYALVCGALVVVFWYWNITGLMESSAAIPCMLVCGTYGGFKIGNVCRR